MVMDDIGAMFGEGDACIIFSVNGRGYQSYGSLMESMKARGCSVILLTMNPHINLIHSASQYVVLPWVSHDYEATALEDQIVFFMFVELLLNEVARVLQRTVQAD